MNRKQSKTSLIIVVASIVALAIGIAYTQLTGNRHRTVLTKMQHAELATKRKPFFASCEASAKASSGVSDTVAEQYCACVLQQVIALYYRDEHIPIPPSDDVRNLTDADAILSFGDRLSATNILDMTKSCLAGTSYKPSP